MVTDLKMDDKNEDAVSIADSGVGTCSVITAATEVSRRHGYVSEVAGWTVWQQIRILYVHDRWFMHIVTCSSY